MTYGIKVNAESRIKSANFTDAIEDVATLDTSAWVVGDVEKRFTSLKAGWRGQKAKEELKFLTSCN